MFACEDKLETESIIGKKTEFKGTLKNKESIRIDGKVEGKIQSEGDGLVPRGRGEQVPKSSKTNK